MRKNLLRGCEKSIPRRIVLGDGKRVFATPRVSSVLKMRLSSGNEHYERFVGLDKVLYVPSLHTNLISCSKPCDNQYKVNFGRHMCNGMLDGTMQFQGRKSQGNYQIVGQPILPGFQSASVAALDWSQKSDDGDNKSPGPGGTIRSSCYSVMKRWHARLGNANTEIIKNLIRSDAVTRMSIRPNTSRRGDCDSCVKGKQARETLGTNHSKSQEPGTLIHTDVCGPMSVSSFPGCNY